METLSLIGMILFGIWVTVIVTYSYIFSPIRSFFMKWPIIGYFIGCPLCVGSWVGFLVSLFVSINYVFLTIPIVSLVSCLLVKTIELIEEAYRCLVIVGEELQNSGRKK